MAKRITKEGIEASSSTYRRATNEVHNRILHTRPIHSRIPSQDFADSIDLVEGAMGKRALKWYQLGLVRGAQQAIDQWISKGLVEVKGNKAYTQKKNLQFRVKVRIHRETPWESLTINVKPSEVGIKRRKRVQHSKSVWLRAKAHQPRH